MSTPPNTRPNTRPDTRPNTRPDTRRTRAAHALFAAAFAFAGLAVLAPGLQSGADAAQQGVTEKVTATRTFIDEDGTTREVTSDEVELTVSQTQDLRGRQEVQVAWRGAHPTGGVVGDPSSSEARNQEYPFVLLQCRGVDAATAPRGQVRLTPETCWTQTSPERYLAAATQTPAWRFDADASAADRQPVVGAPDPLPPECAAVSQPTTARWLPFRAANGEVYYGGPDPNVGCTPVAPESDSAEAGGLPSNTVYGITGADGTGEASFSVWTGVENGSLGCSATVACALVAVPIVGLSCDAYGTRLPAGEPQTTRSGIPLTRAQMEAGDAGCRRTGAYAPGEPRSSAQSDQAVRGQLWWSASNWRNRITVPLQFAVTGSVCDTDATEEPEQLLGSVVASELTASWQPAFCTTPGLFNFTHIEQSDSLARTLVGVGEIPAGLSTAPPDDGFARPAVQAPLTVGGFAIAFTIDDAEHRRQTSLRLNARLVAKLLTSSYPGLAVVRDNHPSIGGNPINITLDPEFQALNPGLPVTSNLEAAAALQTFSSTSDVMWALSSWLDADPEARAWLDGYADPWGMTVNATYRSIDLPVDSWPLLDSWLAPDYYKQQNACYDRSPTPMMQLIANPTSTLGSVVVNLQYASSAVQVACRFDGTDPNTLALKPQGRQTVGYRFVLGVVSLSAAERYNLTTAALQSTSTVSPSARFADASGRTFVAGDDAGLQAAVELLRPRPAAGTWVLDYTALSRADGARAYPGTMPVYAVVPTQGLATATATRIAKLLCYASGPGQETGTGNGQLPPGYLPVTEASGLGAQRGYLLAATAAVRAQAGDVPALDATPPARETACDFTVARVDPTPTPSPTDQPTDAPSSDGAGPAAGPGVDVDADVDLDVDLDVSPAPDGAAPVTPVSATPPPGVAALDGADLAAASTPGQTSLFGKLGMPGLLVLALGCALAGALTRWYEVVAATITTVRGGVGP